MMSLPLKASKQHCLACRKAVNEKDSFLLIDRVCHPACFKCQICLQNLNSTMFCVALGDLYCEKHYKDALSTSDRDALNCPESERSDGRLQNGRNKSTCFICGLPVDEPEPLIGLNGMFHGDCFRCHLCRRLLNAEMYKVIDGKPCCEPACERYQNDHDRSGNLRDRNEDGDLKNAIPLQDRSRSVPPHVTNKENCFNCDLPVKVENRLDVMNRVYHRNCFRCQYCGIVLSPDKCNVNNDEPCCQPQCVEQIRLKSARIPLDLDFNNRSYTCTKKNVITRSNTVTMGSDLNVFKGDAEKVAKIQRLLKQIQASGVEDVTCYVCGRKVYLAERLQVLNRIYHPECLKCDTCHRVLNGARYAAHEGKTYCVAHHREILNQKTINKSDWSTKSVANMNERPMEKENIIKPKVVFDEAKPEELKCYECEIKVYPAERLNILNRVYHRTCFRCKTCHNILDLGRYGVFEGTPYCNAHHKQAVNLGSVGSLSVNTPVIKTPTTPQQKRIAMHVESEAIKCYECNKIVYPAEKLNILKRIYHRNCFKCATCNKVLHLGRYGVCDGKPYCNAHHKRASNLSSASKTNVSVVMHANNTAESDENQNTRSQSKTRCFDCGELTQPEASLILSDRVYHVECLKCRACRKQLSRWNYKELDGLIYCSRDYAEIVVNRAKASTVGFTEASNEKQRLYI